MSNNKTIFLLSSNATKEYILDVLEVLALPFGMVQHFRYQLKLIDEDLKGQLPLKKNSKENPFKDNKVVICYLYQVKGNSGRKWEAIYPIRTGVLIEAYKTGNRPYDIAHFYFRLENYILECRNIINDFNLQGIEKTGPDLEGKGIGDNILVFAENLDLKTANKEGSKSVFHTICQSIKIEHLKSPDGNVQYFPLFTSIDGIKNKKNEFLNIEYDKTTMKSFYTLSEGERYSFTFSIYFPQKPPEYLITLSSDEKIFSTPSKYELKQDSMYYEESWNLISSLLERDVYTMLSFKAELKSTDSSKRPLNISMDFLIKVRRKIKYRFYDALRDIGFGIGTGAIALKVALGANKMTWWYWPTGAGYFLWLLFTVIIKFWRG